MSKFKLATLPNGGKLAYTKNKVSKSTIVEIVFDCGSRFDTIPGLAHFTEHMFFTGTKTLNKDEISKKYFDFMNVNAFTNSKNIAFTGNVFTKEFAEYLSTVAMLINESTFTQKAVNNEIPVVQQEIAASADNFKRKSAEFHNFNLTNGEVYKNKILGNEKSVASIKSKDVKEFVKKFFVANNMWVYVSSPLAFNKVKNIVIKNLEEKLSTNQNLPNIPLFYAPIANKNFYKIQYEDIKKAYLYITFPFNRNYNDIIFKRKFQLVLEMLNDYSEGVMKYLRLNKSLTYGAYFSASYEETMADLTFRTECDKQNLNELIKTLAEYLSNLLKNGFTEQQLNKAKREFDYETATQQPNVKRNYSKLFDFKFYGKTFNYKELIKIARQTTLEECNQMLKEVFAGLDVGASIYGNLGKQDVMDKKEFMQLFKF